MHDQHVTRPLPTHRITQTQNKGGQASMPRVGFEPTFPEFERAKTFCTIDRVSTVISILTLMQSNSLLEMSANTLDANANCRT
jgi:hypothetical protein